MAVTSPRPEALGQQGQMQDAKAQDAPAAAKDDGQSLPSSATTPSLTDAASSGIPRCARVLVFALICQGVQMFMSYDGGAVPASLDTLQKKMVVPWTEFEIGLLGAMDKIGMVAASLPWGFALQVCNAKLLLVLSLLVNAACTFIFGLLNTKSLMYLAKFVMGVTQSLQGVWGTVWTINMSPPDTRTMWLGLGTVSAGAGNGIGTVVAGFGTANGLPYAFAFQFAGVVLMLLWVALLCMPSKWLRMEESKQAEGQAIEKEMLRTVSLGGKSATTPSESGVTFIQQVVVLLRNRVFLWTTLSISLFHFEVNGIQYLWTRVFVTIWKLDKNWVTLMFLLVNGGGCGLGIAFGPWFIDRHGGFHEPSGVVKTLRILFNFQLLAALGGAVGVAMEYGKLHEEGQSGEWGDRWLWGSWLSILLICFAHNACVAALCGINMQVVPEQNRTFASGTEITVRNILGFICAPLLPGVVMSLNTGFDEKWQLSVGMGFMYLANFLGFILLAGARAAASKDLDRQRFAALSVLRQACQAQDVTILERAVKRAKQCNLQKWKDGDAVIGMANEVIGQYHAYGEGQRDIVLAAATHAELRSRALSLERKLAEQSLQLKRCHDELEQLRAAAAPRSTQDFDMEANCVIAI